MNWAPFKPEYYLKMMTVIVNHDNIQNPGNKNKKFWRINHCMKRLQTDFNQFSIDV